MSRIWRKHQPFNRHRVIRVLSPTFCLELTPAPSALWQTPAAVERLVVWQSLLVQPFSAQPLQRQLCPSSPQYSGLGDWYRWFRYINWRLAILGYIGSKIFLVFNQEDTEPTIDGRDVSGLSPVVSTMMVMANPLQTCAGGPLPATTPLPTLVEA